jgi:SAM-dependent methyltransferase
MSRGHFIGLNHHRLMLADGVRMEAYQRAIEAQVRPGMHVLDLGSGTGILALWAARAGAQVTAVEPNAVIRVAERVAADNGLADRIRFVQADAREITLDEPVDLLITECMGNFFVTDEMQPVLRDARRFFRADESGAQSPQTIPHGISLQLAVATLPLWRELSYFDEPIGGFDYRAARGFGEQASYVLRTEPEFLVSRTHELTRFSLLDAPDVFELSFRLELTRAAPVHALIGYFEADLGADVLLSTAPGAVTHWGQMAFPLPETRVQVGDMIEGRLELKLGEDGSSRFRWSGEIQRVGRRTVSFLRDSSRRFEPLAPSDAGARVGEL